MNGTSLRSLALLAVFAVLTLAERTHAQDGSDSSQIRQVIDVYFRGHATANADTMRAAFLPTAHIEGIRNGVFTSWTVDQYVAGFRSTPAADEAARTRVIDIGDRRAEARAGVPPRASSAPKVVVRRHHRADVDAVRVSHALAL